MSRRELITLLGRVAIMMPFPAIAQRATKLPTVGFLFPGPHAEMLARVEAMRNGLRTADYSLCATPLDL
jgi:hypothetical protein